MLGLRSRLSDGTSERNAQVYPECIRRGSRNPEESPCPSHHSVSGRSLPARADLQAVVEGTEGETGEKRESPLFRARSSVSTGSLSHADSSHQVAQESRTRHLGDFPFIPNKLKLFFNLHHIPPIGQYSYFRNTGDLGTQVRVEVMV